MTGAQRHGREAGAVSDQSRVPPHGVMPECQVRIEDAILAVHQVKVAPLRAAASGKGTGYIKGQVPVGRHGHP